MEWEDLRFFRAVAIQQNLAAAARDLGVSQATVWRHVGQLETSLEARLFTRRGSGYALSQIGERLLETANRVADEIKEAQRQLSDDTRKLRGEIRLTAPELLEDMLTKQLKALGLRHPELRLELITGTPIAALSRKQTDIALRYGTDVQADFAIEKRYAVGFGVYASRAYLRKHGRPVAIDGFSGHELIGFDDSVGHVAPLKWVRRGGKEARVSFRSNSLRARAFAATAGVGCALLPSLVGDSSAGLEKIFGPDSVGSLELCLLGNSHVRTSPRVMAVTQYVIDVLDERSVALAGR